MSFREVTIPGRRLKQNVADRVHRAFVERFAPEGLPRIAPPLWGKAFEHAAIVDSSYLRTPAFLQHRHVLCLVNTALPKPAKKFQRPVYMCRSDALAETLTSLHWRAHGDFYIFDRTCEWFVAALNERIHQMDDAGRYKLLVSDRTALDLSAETKMD
jgi:hypothetical protein